MTTLTELLEHKAEIDGLPEGQQQFTLRLRWLLAAVEHLLRLEQERRSADPTAWWDETKGSGK